MTVIDRLHHDGTSPPDYSSAWEAHYDELALEGEFVMFDRESEDYVDRLNNQFRLDAGTAVFDFGCGFGAVAERLAQQEVRLKIWDRSTNMREVASSRLSRFPNAGLLNLEQSDKAAAHEFDLILVNSVIQYMSTDELQDWLRRWRGMLKHGGRIIISDIIPPGIGFLAEIYDSIRFAMHKGYLVRSLGKLGQEFFRYLNRRRRLQLLRFGPEELSKMAASAGLTTEFLAENLTFRRGRKTAVLSGKTVPSVSQVQPQT